MSGAAAIRAGHHVVVAIKLSGGTGKRPAKVQVSYEFVDVETRAVTYSNQSTFKNDEFQEFDRLSTEEIEALDRSPGT